MRRSFVGLIALAAMLCFVPAAVAGDRPLPASGVFSASRLEPFVREAAVNARQVHASGRTSGRDSIWNGGLIGAAIGGVGGSALIVASSGGSDNIPRAMLNVCVPPALAGFAVGSIVDALR